MLSTTVDIMHAISRSRFSPPISRNLGEELGLRDHRRYGQYAVSAYRCPLVTGVIFALIAQRVEGPQEYVQDAVAEWT